MQSVKRRIDRIQYDETFGTLPDTWVEPRRHLIVFRYGLAAGLAQGEISQRFAEQHLEEPRRLSRLSSEKGEVDSPSPEWHDMLLARQDSQVRR